MADHYRQQASRWLRRGQDFEEQARLATEPDRQAQLRRHAALCFAKVDEFRARSNAKHREWREARSA